MLRGHIIGICYLSLFFALSYGFQSIAKYGIDNIILAITWLAGISMATLLFLFIFMLFSIVIFPFALLANWAANKIGATSYADYLLIGLAFGLAMAGITQAIMVNNAPDTNLYQPLTGWASTKLYLMHYIRGGTAGILYAIACWHSLNRKAKPAA